MHFDNRGDHHGPTKYVNIIIGKNSINANVTPWYWSLCCCVPSAFQLAQTMALVCMRNRLHGARDGVLWDDIGVCSGLFLRQVSFVNFLWQHMDKYRNISFHCQVNAMLAAWCDGGHQENHTRSSTLSPMSHMLSYPEIWSPDSTNDSGATWFLQMILPKINFATTKIHSPLQRAAFNTSHSLAYNSQVLKCCLEFHSDIQVPHLLKNVVLHMIVAGWILKSKWILGQLASSSDFSLCTAEIFI